MSFCSRIDAGNLKMLLLLLYLILFVIFINSDVLLNWHIQWDLRTFHLLRTVPSLDQCQIHFNRAGNVIYGSEFWRVSVTYAEDCSIIGILCATLAVAFDDVAKWIDELCDNSNNIMNHWQQAVSWLSSLPHLLLYPLLSFPFFPFLFMLHLSTCFSSLPILPE